MALRVARSAARQPARPDGHCKGISSGVAGNGCALRGGAACQGLPGLAVGTGRAFAKLSAGGQAGREATVKVPTQPGWGGNTLAHRERPIRLIGAHPHSVKVEGVKLWAVRRRSCTQ